MRRTTGKKSCRVLIVGCGELGSRHLQAVASLPEVREVEVVDPRPEALELGRQRLAEIPDCSPSISFDWLPSLEKATKGGDLCIIATQADVRCQLLYEAVETLGYSTFLLEKLVAQSVQDYKRVVDFSRRKGLSVWVNCQARAHPLHRHVKECLDPSEPIIFNVVGGNYGLVTNGVHAVDLFAFYDGATWIESLECQVDPILYPSSRGEGLFDLSGTLRGGTKKGSQFTLSYVGNHKHYEHFAIATRNYRCVIDHLQQWAMESDGSSAWSWRRPSFEEGLLVSVMGKNIAHEILQAGRCKLPTLEDCFPAHRFLLQVLLSHFNRLLGRDSDRCPVT